MAIAVDASTPAALLGSGAVTDPLASNSFTPPDGSLIVLGVSGASHTANPMITSVTGGSLSWSAVTTADQGTLAAAELWIAYCATSPGSMTASVDWANKPNQGALLSVVVLTGCDSTQNGAIATPQTGTGQTASVNLTTTRDGSRVFACHANFTSASSPTTGAGQTIVFNGNTMFGTSNGNGYWLQSTSSNTATSGTSVTINDTAPTGLTMAMVAFEVLAAPGGAAPSMTTPAFNAIPFMR
jgi:hypothetical protein